MLANIFDITFMMTIFPWTFGSYVTSAQRICIKKNKKQSYGRSLKHCLENCKAFPPAEFFITTSLKALDLARGERVD